MIRSKRAVLISLAVLCAGSALAEDVPIVENHYDIKKAMKKGKKEPELPLDPKLVKGVTDRIAECYKLEQGAPMNEADRKLLQSWGDDVVRELSPSLRFSSCQIEKAPSERCLADLTVMDCATLAEPIVDAGWDRNLTPKDKERVQSYAKALAMREAACQGRSGEEADIVGGVRKDRLAVLIESQIVIGQCRLMPDRQASCQADLQSMSCEEVLETSNRGEAQKLCPDYLLCSETPKVVDEDPK